MKQRKVEIQVTILAVIIAAAMIASGYYVYQSLSRIIDSIHQETRPDFKLILIKDIASDLNKIENTVRLYSLTEDPSFITSYRQLNASVQENLNNLRDYEVPGSDEIQLIDSIRLLTNKKLLIWEEIRSLHNKRKNVPDSFSELYSKIDTAIIQPDTIVVQKKEKKGFFKRLFGKKDTSATAPVILDKTEEKENLKQEIANIEQRISTSTRQFQFREKALLERNIQVTSQLSAQISKLEAQAQANLRVKTEEADFMAAQTYRRLTVFTIAAMILLLTVLVIFFRNIQQNQAYQRILKKAKAEAESLARAKEMFVATVSHEMRTPINAIYGLTEQMLQKTNTEEINGDLQVVHRSAEHLITLVNDTLDFSKIESQKLKIEQIDFLPDEVFKEVLILNREAAATKGIELIINNRMGKNLTLKGDPIRLKQILINLVSNAIKFTSQGQVSLLASCKEEEDGTFRLQAEVSDTGVGISREDTDRIFEEFVQLDTDLMQKHRGAGLGLAIVKKLVEIQGGKISVNSIPGKGTCFSFEIPYKQGNAENIKRQPVEQPVIPEHMKDLHFLLVDDEEFNLHLLKNILKKWGTRFTEATNGKEAVEKVSAGKFDLIFMDMRMPVMDGYEASKQILIRKPDARIIALTATNKPEDIRKSKEAGMVGFLQKPFTEAALLNIVTETLRQQAHPENPYRNREDPPVDLNELEKLTGGDQAFLEEMVQIFIRSSEKCLVNLQKDAETGNRTAISESAHKLAAPAKHMMAMSLYEDLKTLEILAESGKDPEEIKRLTREVDEQIRQINAFLRQKFSV